MPKKARHYWPVFEKSEVGVCHVDLDFEIHVDIEAALRDMSREWVDWASLQEANQFTNHRIEHRLCLHHAPNIEPVVP